MKTRLCAVALLAAAFSVFAMTAAGGGTAAPNRAQIDTVMNHTVEASDPSFHFSAGPGRAALVTVSDGHGGTLTAVVGTRSPTADGYGQLVFFWHNTSFLGWDSKYETVAVASVKPNPSGGITVRYGHYKARDPFCCPSLPPTPVTYRWSGSRLAVTGSEPFYPGPRVRVKYLP